MVKDGLAMKGDEIREEWEEAEREINEESDAVELDTLENGLENGHSSHTSPSKGVTNTLKEGTRNLCGLCFSPIFAQAFVLTFLGEWGDRSQIATIALAAAHNVVLVCVGTIAGHACCTALAVVGGSVVAERISVKKVTLGGAGLFLIFAVIYAVEAYNEPDLKMEGVVEAAKQAAGQGLGAR